MTEDPANLIERARAGSREALEALVVAHLPALRAFVRVQANRELRELESCSDLVQSACREVLADLSSFEYRGEATFRCWLYRCAERDIDRDPPFPAAVESTAATSSRLGR